MASTATLEEKFHAAVKAIQRLPNDGTFQPSNEMKLTFYGLYKQATVGPPKDARPSILNYVNRAKWDAWDKCRTLSKEAAMTAYIDEIRKILETMPQTTEVLEFTQLIGPFYEFVDDRAEQNGPTTMKKKLNNSIPSKSNLNEPLVNGNSDGQEFFSDVHHSKLPNGTTQTFVSSSNGPIPSSSPSSSSSSTISSSDVEDFYEDPSDRLPVEENVPITSDPPSHVYGGQNGNTNPSTTRSHRHHHHSNQSPSRSSIRQQISSTGARNSPSSMISGAGGSGRYPNSSYNKETQRAILTALTKLQHDVNNILERLNRLETSAYFLQQREIVARQRSSHSVFRWLPLAGLRRRAVAFIVLWPFVVFALVRLFLRARIIIRFRKTRL